MKKVLMLATTAAMIEQFNKRNIEILRNMGYVVDVAGNFSVGNPISKEKIEQFKIWIEEGGGEWIQIPVTRNPYNIGNIIKSIRILCEKIQISRYYFVHCHTPVGSVIGRVVAHKTNTMVIYTAHGFHFYKGAPLKNWILYYPIERFLSKWTDVLILITKEDFLRAKETFHAKRIEYLPGVGIDLEAFRKFDETKINDLRESLGIPKEDKILLSVGELNKNKNHQLIIRTLKCMRRKDIHYVIVGHGVLKDQLKKLAKKTGLQNRVHVLGFQEDVNSFYHMSDLFVLPSLREGLNVSLMEAMATGLPIVCNNIRGNNDLLINGEGGFLLNRPTCKGYGEAIQRILENNTLLIGMGTTNLKNSQEFDKTNIDRRMKQIYESMKER